MTMENSKNKVYRYNKIQRTRYFHGMLLDDKDFTTEQGYHIEKRKLHNRVLHGWGVVCGLEIEYIKGERQITIKPGMALDCHGNEIQVCKPVSIDLTDDICPDRVGRSQGTNVSSCEEPDKKEDKCGFHIGIAFHEAKTAPEPTYVPDDECEKRQCDYSRNQEGFCIGFFKECPPQPPHTFPAHPGVLKQWMKTDKSEETNARQGGAEEDNEKSLFSKFCPKAPPCPACCPDEHYIILGNVEIDSKKTTVRSVCINDCRTYVLGPNLFKYLFSSIFGGVSGFSEGMEGVKALLESAGQMERNKEEGEDIFELIYTNPVKAVCRIAKEFQKPARIDYTKEIRKLTRRIEQLENNVKEPGKQLESKGEEQERTNAKAPKKTKSPGKKTGKTDRTAASKKKK